MTIVNGKLARMKSLYRVAVLLLLLAAPELTFATPDLKFDVVTFCCGCSSSICQSHFDELNFPTTNGHYIAMGTDAHRLELATNGNLLAIYYNTLNDGYSTNSGAQAATNIDQYAMANFTSTGPKPSWVVLNEISAGLWPSDANYRTYVRDIVHTLRTVFGYTVIVYSPFPNPGANSTDWQAVAADAYIGIENYLSGSEVMSQGFSVSYCQSQYQSSITSYTALGVPRAKLMLGEHFAQTLSGTSYGRSGVSSNDWDSALIARDQAAQNVAFAGFLSYAWGGNDMGVSTNEQLHFEDTYRTSNLPVNVGVTAPYVVIQPQSPILPNGSSVSFSVFKAGTAPTTYQWRFNGTNIPGATDSSLNLANVDVAAAGNYSVALTNSAGWTISSNAFFAVQVPPPFAFEPFAPAQTAYTPGSSLIGQTNAEGRTWFSAGPVGTDPTVQGGSLPVTGLASLQGNSVATFGGVNGPSARFGLLTNFNTGTIYYSLAFKVMDRGSLGTSGGFFAAFNDSTGNQSGTPTIIACGLQTRKDGTGFDIGLKKAAAGSLFDTNAHALNETVFVVASYTFNNGATNDDVAQLWINPPPSTFGAASPPPPTLMTNGSPDLDNGSGAKIASFVLFERGSANATLQPATTIFDEIRVGTTWASVTPPAEVANPPLLSVSRSGDATVLNWSTNAPGFALESATSISNPASWGAVTNPIYTAADQYVVTNVTESPTTFYRLRSPR
jgi:hypothetical protein